LAAVIERIPPPKGNVDEPLQALIWLTTIHSGIEVIFRVINGEIKKGQKIVYGYQWIFRRRNWNFKTKSSTEKVIPLAMVI
jgi:translation elongation factor EF-4